MFAIGQGKRERVEDIGVECIGQGRWPTEPGMNIPVQAPHVQQGVVGFGNHGGEADGEGVEHDEGEEGKEAEDGELSEGKCEM